jgi:hypothetical protein
VTYTHGDIYHFSTLAQCDITLVYYNTQVCNRTHTKDGGKAPIVPKKLQEKLPESVERAVANAIHSTDDTGGLHRKQ